MECTFKNVYFTWGNGLISNQLHSHLKKKDQRFWSPTSKCYEPQQLWKRIDRPWFVFTCTACIVHEVLECIPWLGWHVMKFCAHVELTFRGAAYGSQISPNIGETTAKSKWGFPNINIISIIDFRFFCMNTHPCKAGKKKKKGCTKFWYPVSVAVIVSQVISHTVLFIPFLGHLLTLTLRSYPL